MNIKQLFTPAVDAKVLPSQNPVKANEYDNASISNNDNRRNGESYVKYGTRICGQVNGSLQAFVPFLQRIYNQERLAQEENKNLQSELKERLLQDKENLEAKLTKTKNDVDLSKEKIKSKNEDILGLRGEIAELKGKANELNKNANAKMWLGVLILIPLTVYLFSFYSSTFYSAFFKDFSTAAVNGVQAAMFDPNAIPNAWNDGATELIFVMCAPIIFLGLGFSLHFFTKQEGPERYLKASAIIAVTFAFDCILAYLIGKNIYEVTALNSLEDMSPYSFVLAVTDVNTWAVIFCGFIVYIIWGIVFNMAYSGYDERFSNSHAIEVVQQKIDNEKKNLQILQQEETGLRNEIVGLNGQIESLTRRLTNNVFIDNGIIKTALSDFNAGWMQLMAPLGLSVEKQEQTRSLYQSTINTLFPATPTKP